MTVRMAFFLFCSLILQAKAQKNVLNFGDSITLQSSQYLPAALGEDFVIYSVPSNGKSSFFGAAQVKSWLKDPDSDPFTAQPAQWDIVRFNHGVWDAIPITGRVTSVEDYLKNLISIIEAIREHSPQAKIIFSTSPLVDEHRATMNPAPASGLVDVENYNQSLKAYRKAALENLTGLEKVWVDDKHLFYLEHAPANFPELPAPANENTGEAWHWDGIHFDPAYCQFEAQQTAKAILLVE